MSTSALLVRLQKGPACASHPACSDLLPQITTPPAGLTQKRVFSFSVGMLSVMLWMSTALQLGCHPGGDSKDEQAGARGFWGRNFYTCFVAEGNTAGNDSLGIFLLQTGHKTRHGLTRRREAASKSFSHQCGPSPLLSRAAPMAAGDTAVHEIKRYAAWREDHSQTHSSGVILGSDGSAVGNRNRNQGASTPVPALLPCGMSKAPRKPRTGQRDYNSQPLTQKPFLAGKAILTHLLGCWFQEGNLPQFLI